ncbi:MAG: PH domain-containing protein [Anaerolineaceae bacterium]|jgi:uncharacterized membrane protein YdbT with pleckstrin-like domain
MGYIEKRLANDETIIYRAKTSWKVLIWPMVLLILINWLASKVHPLFLFFTIILSVVLIIQVILIIITTEFALTNRRIIAKRGVILQHSLEILLKQVESIAVSQPLVGRIFGFGTVTVNGSGGTQEFFKSIDNPMELRRQVNDQISEQSI